MGITLNLFKVCNRQWNVINVIEKQIMARKTQLCSQ